MSPAAILFPVFAMFLLTAAVSLRLYYVNLGAARTRVVSGRYFKLYRGDDVPDYMLAAADRYKNLFEQPVLFYVVCILLYVTQELDTVDLALAWSYAGFRLIHSTIRATSNTVPYRSAAFAVSSAILLGLWVKFMVQTV